MCRKLLKLVGTGQSYCNNKQVYFFWPILYIRGPLFAIVNNTMSVSLLCRELSFSESVLWYIQWWRMSVCIMYMYVLHWLHLRLTAHVRKTFHILYFCSAFPFYN